MQTFLPYLDFGESARVLDMRRLGKQRVEALQLIRGSWPHHPASKMWRGYEHALGEYGICVCREWIRRGYKDTCLEKIGNEMMKFELTGSPLWLGDEAFHASHRSNLLRKNAAHYRQYFPHDVDNLPYVWPVR